jgi:hypothetical protein
VTAGFSSGNTGTGQTIYIAQNTGRFMLFLGLASAAVALTQFLSCCGGLDSSGAMSTGMQVFGKIISQHIPVSGTVPSQKTIIPCNFGTDADTTTGGQVMTGHPFLWDSTGGKNPTLAVAVGGTSNTTTATTTTLTVYGGSHTYLATTVTNPNGASANNRVLVIYE